MKSAPDDIAEATAWHVGVEFVDIIGFRFRVRSGVVWCALPGRDRWHPSEAYPTVEALKAAVDGGGFHCSEAAGV